MVRRITYSDGQIIVVLIEAEAMSTEDLLEPNTQMGLKVRRFDWELQEVVTVVAITTS